MRNDISELTYRLCTFLDSVHAIFTTEDVVKFMDDNFESANVKYSVDSQIMEREESDYIEELFSYIEKTTAYSLAELCLKDKAWVLEPYGKTSYTQDYTMSFVMYKPSRR